MLDSTKTCPTSSMSASDRRFSTVFSAATPRRLWVAALAGLVAPLLMVRFWPEHSWAQEAAGAFQASQAAGDWVSPWVAVEQAAVDAGWIRCGSLRDALALDRKIDDGVLHSGRLVLAEGGLVWLP